MKKIMAFGTALLFTFSIAGLFVFYVTGTSVVFASESPDISVIPRPNRITPREGIFTLTSETKIISGPGTEALGQYLIGISESDMGFRLNHTLEKSKEGLIELKLDSSLKNLGMEGYELDITPDRITLKAQHPAGLFYSIQTLRQLLMFLPEKSTSSDIESSRNFPCVTITDKPRFGWRGLMIDCSRTFWNKEYIKRYIDLLAFHKMNVLHLHLTDDQGWRVEIKKYPKLTEAGSKFDSRYKGETGGYYSQDDIRELVKYAASRFVTIVPEIDLPGHFTAGIVAYPWLSCTGRDDLWIFPFDKRPEGIASLTEDILCAGNEKVFEFLEGVFDEIIELFPSRYIHIGGDEAPKVQWKKCEKCQARIRSEGLKDENELQSYMTKRIADYLESRGRTLIGWDEIIEGGLADNAAVMYWRGWIKGPDIEAVRSGSEVVMSPTTHCYFDYTYTRISTEHVYSFEPINSELTAEQTRLILGAQANMWTHIARTEEDVDRQIFPRLAAMAEVSWSEKSSRNWDNFKNRMGVHQARLKKLGVQYFVDPVLWNE